MLAAFGASGHHFGATPPSHSIDRNLPGSNMTLSRISRNFINANLCMRSFVVKNVNTSGMYIWDC